MRENVALIIVGRLNAGWLMIDAEPDLEKRARLEDFWIALLHDYEAACDRDRIDTQEAAA